MITRWLLVFSWTFFVIDLTFSVKGPSMSFQRRRQLDEGFRRVTKQCEQKEICQKYLPNLTIKIETSSQQQQKEIAEIDRINCVRRCISSACYREIYEKDPLERGEIDVRSGVFKTCWSKEHKM